MTVRTPDHATRISRNPPTPGTRLKPKPLVSSSDRHARMIALTHTPWCRATTTRRLAGDLFHYPRLKSPRPPTRTSRPVFLVFACGYFVHQENSICKPARFARNYQVTCIKVPDMQGRLKFSSPPQPVSNGTILLAYIRDPI